MSVLTSVSPSNPHQFLPSSFNSSYGADVRITVPSSVESTNEHLHLSQEVTQQGNNASSIKLGGRQQDRGNDPNEDGPQFTMDEDDGSDEVRSKTPPLYGINKPVPVARQSSTSDTDSTVTSTRSESCAPVQEENDITYHQKISIKILRERLCQGICRSENAAPHLEKTISIKMNGTKVVVDLQFSPHSENDNKFVSFQAYYNFPEGRKPLMKFLNIINSYRWCVARVIVSVYDPQTRSIIAEEKSESKPIDSEPCVLNVKIEKLVEHGSIIYATTKYLVFKVKAEIVCRGKITATDTTGEGAENVVVVDY